MIVGLGQNARELASLIEQSEPLGLRLIGFVNPGSESSHKVSGLKSQYPIFALADVYGILQNHVVDELLFAVGNDQLESLEGLIDRCHKEGIRTRVDLGFFPRTFPRVHLENLRHVPLLTLGSTPNNEFALFAKRVSDLVASTLALIVLSPLLLIVSILVKWSSPGPILYRQTRSGLNGRRFKLYKFRSMVANADELRPELEAFNEIEGPAFKMKNDPRCTPLGRWLRKFSLDELPQLWNMLYWGYVLRRSAASSATGSGEIRALAAAALAHASGTNLFVDVGRAQPAQLRPTRAIRPGLHRQLVVMAGREDFSQERFPMWRQAAARAEGLARRS